VPGTDRRQQLVTVTEAGATALDHLRELRVELVHRLVRGLDPAELRALETALGALDREAQHLDEADAVS
jgi:DNA-binding MarR family transcriptional regulator